MTKSLSMVSHKIYNLDANEDFVTLQTRFGSSKYPLSKQPFKTQPQIENEDIT